MFFKETCINYFNSLHSKSTVNNNVVTSHIVGNGNKVINVVNGNRIVNKANSGSKEVAKKYELSKECLHLSIKEAVLKPDIILRTGEEKLFLPTYADKKDYRKVLTSILVSCALVLFLLGTILAEYFAFPLLILPTILMVAFTSYICIFEADIRSIESYETKHFSKKDFLLVKEFCPEEESLWMQAIKQAILDDNDAAEKYARNVLTLANKRKKVVQKKESSKWEELSTQKEIQVGFEEDIV